MLRQTLSYLFDRILTLSQKGKDPRFRTGGRPRAPTDSEIQTFLWNRTRAIRADIALQRYGPAARNDAVVIETLERIARQHIMFNYVCCEDRSFNGAINMEQFNNCLKLLLELYQDAEERSHGLLRSPNEAEFYCYFVLVHLADRSGRSSLQGALSRVPPRVLHTSQMKFALDCFTSFNTGNYAKFWRLVYDAPILCGCLLHRHFRDFRELIAPEVLLGGGNMGVPLSKFASILGYATLEDAVEHCVQYGLDVSNSPSLEQAVVRLSKLKKPDYSFPKFTPHLFKEDIFQADRRKLCNGRLWASQCKYLLLPAGSPGTSGPGSCVVDISKLKNLRAKLPGPDTAKAVISFDTSAVEDEEATIPFSPPLSERSSTHRAESPSIPMILKPEVVRPKPTAPAKKLKSHHYDFMPTPKSSVTPKSSFFFEDQDPSVVSIEDRSLDVVRPLDSDASKARLTWGDEEEEDGGAATSPQWGSPEKDVTAETDSVWDLATGTTAEAGDGDFSSGWGAAPSPKPGHGVGSTLSFLSQTPSKTNAPSEWDEVPTPEDARVDEVERKDAEARNEELRRLEREAEAARIRAAEAERKQRRRDEKLRISRMAFLFLLWKNHVAEITDLRRRQNASLAQDVFSVAIVPLEPRSRRPPSGGISRPLPRHPCVHTVFEPSFGAWRSAFQGKHHELPCFMQTFLEYRAAFEPLAQPDERSAGDQALGVVLEFMKSSAYKPRASPQEAYKAFQFLSAVASLGPEFPPPGVPHLQFGLSTKESSSIGKQLWSPIQCPPDTQARPSMAVVTLEQCIFASAVTPFGAFVTTSTAGGSRGLSNWLVAKLEHMGQTKEVSVDHVPGLFDSSHTHSNKRRRISALGKEETVEEPFSFPSVLVFPIAVGLKGNGPGHSYTLDSQTIVEAFWDCISAIPVGARTSVWIPLFVCASPEPRDGKHGWAWVNQQQCEDLVTSVAHLLDLFNPSEDTASRVRFWRISTLQGNGAWLSCENSWSEGGVSSDEPSEFFLESGDVASEAVESSKSWISEQFPGLLLPPHALAAVATALYSSIETKNASQLRLVSPMAMWAAQVNATVAAAANWLYWTVSKVS